jgi:hypothetical protein
MKPSSASSTRHSVTEWRVLLGEEGFTVEGLYGWFDRRPWAGHEDSIWVCRRD